MAAMSMPLPAPSAEISELVAEVVALVVEVVPVVAMCDRTAESVRD